jgi:predicted  nucleic acid-binding Zn-ribbon protein
LSSYELDLVAEIDSGELMRTYKRLRQNWSREFALELVRMYKSINYLREDYEKLRKEMEHLDMQLSRLENALE